jgi:hypothetical protein
MSALGRRIIDIPVFLSHLMGAAPYSAWRDRMGPAVTVMQSLPNGGKHIIIHRKFSTAMEQSSSSTPQLLQTIYEISLIEKSGLPLPKYSHAFFEGQAVIQFIGKISSIKNRHVFSTIGQGMN